MLITKHKTETIKRPKVEAWEAQTMSSLFLFIHWVKSYRSQITAYYPLLFRPATFT